MCWFIGSKLVQEPRGQAVHYVHQKLCLSGYYCICGVPQGSILPVLLPVYNLYMLLLAHFIQKQKLNHHHYVNDSLLMTQITLRAAIWCPKCDCFVPYAQRVHYGSDGTDLTDCIKLQTSENHLHLNKEKNTNINLWCRDGVRLSILSSENISKQKAVKSLDGGTRLL